MIICHKIKVSADLDDSMMPLSERSNVACDALIGWLNIDLILSVFVLEN